MSHTALESLYRHVRRFTETLCAPLEPEDYVVQTMPDVSPAKWHLAHTSWFFETFVVRPSLPGYHMLDERYAMLFNSYYHAAGARHPRPARGLLSRPTVREVYAYREHVDAAMAELFASADHAQLDRLAFVIEVGLNHEEQHQELLLTDLKHVFAYNPLEPAYRQTAATLGGVETPALRWVSFDGGLREIGHGGPTFAFDNEQPRHRVHVYPFALADRLVTAGEYLEFMADGGYSRPELWLSDGWDAVTREGWQAPLYWKAGEAGDRSGWRITTLGGTRWLDPHEPVCHVSHYEADAYARWKEARLPSEAEWELAAERASAERGNFVERDVLHPVSLAQAAAPGEVAQLLGDVWEWTASPYVPYPGFRSFTGSLAEYNGKFMASQMVLRGGSCVTPRRHIRATYRNFFPPSARWQFSGIRLARSLGQ